MSFKSFWKNLVEEPPPPPKPPPPPPKPKPIQVYRQKIQNKEIKGILFPIFAVVIGKLSDKPVYTAELNESSAVARRFPRLFIG